MLTILLIYSNKIKQFNDFFTISNVEYFANKYLYILKFNDTKVSGEFYDVYVELSAFNSGYHSVAIVSYDIIVNNKIIEFNKVIKKTIDRDYEFIHPKGPNLPRVLKEGELLTKTINAVDLFKLLRDEEFNGEVEISGRFETSQQKIYQTNKLKTDITGFEEWP